MASNTLAGIPLKYITLVSLTLQNSLLAILLHHSRTVSNKKLYSASAAVLLNEILKCLISFLVALHNSYNRKISLTNRPHSRGTNNHDIYGTVDSSVQLGESSKWNENEESTGFLRKPQQVSMLEQDFEDWKRSSRGVLPNLLLHSKQILSEIISGDCWKLSIPAILYVIQNNLQFVAAANLDVATFSVTYQLKILTTAMCSVVMLRRRLSASKWISLFFLAVGVALVQLNQTNSSGAKSKMKDHSGTADRFIGFVAVTSACFTSGLAGVYFELVLKSSNKVDLWVRNIQLSLFSLLPALFTSLVTSSSTDGEHLFSNFGFWAWATVLTQVVGGLVTALVIKFADNILKGFATSLSIILSTLAGVFLFGSPFPVGSAFGALVVLMSTFSYNHFSDTPPPSTSSSSLINPFNSSSNPIIARELVSTTTSVSPARSQTPTLQHQYDWSEKIMNEKRSPIRRTTLSGKEKERIS
ncbi:nucleotide-sugar transporter-domain-containing protein [Phakopsora pachyrhizi]|uniref:Nucleotide-sugar transporter-domain-containing protein n=1 Tax=Phakopsora pachyrhizi TaxID=170000 RepID=A0AAV0BN50_PHAPC|nr:nucleotide-sugar transporter-domain-containing protein [Phakopsora pachyrhizi]